MLQYHIFMMKQILNYIKSYFNPFVYEYITGIPGVTI